MYYSYIFACKLEDHDGYTSANHCKGHLVGGKSPVTSVLTDGMITLVKTFQMERPMGEQEVVICVNCIGKFSECPSFVYLFFGVFQA